MAHDLPGGVESTRGGVGSAFLSQLPPLAASQILCVSPRGSELRAELHKAPALPRF